MNVKINNILKSYQKIVNAQNKTTGSVFKHFRTKRKMTLEEVAKGICSISYLCKVERDQLIVEESKKHLLMERLGIKEEDLNADKKDTSWISEIVSKNQVEDNLYKESLLKYDYQSKLIVLAYLVLNEKDSLKAFKALNESMNYYVNFNKYELEFFIYLVINYLYLIEKYNQLVELFYEYQTFSENINILLNSVIVTVEALYYLNRHTDIKYLLENYVNVFLKYNRFNNLQHLKMIELKIKAQDSSYDSLMEEIENLEKSSAIDINYLKFLHYFNLKDFNKALIHLDKIDMLNERIYLKQLIMLEEHNKKDLLKKHLTNPIITFSKPSYIMSFQLLADKYINDSDLNNSEAIFINNVTDDYLIISFVIKLLLEHSKNNFYYKRSVELLEKEVQLLREKSKTIYNK